jgi:hypothetical protein
MFNDASGGRHGVSEETFSHFAYWAIWLSTIWMNAS